MEAAVVPKERRNCASHCCVSDPALTCSVLSTAAMQRVSVYVCLCAIASSHVAFKALSLAFAKSRTTVT